MLGHAFPKKKEHGAPVKDRLSGSTAKRAVRSERVGSIDAARGAAMLFVCLAHFTNSYHFVSGSEVTQVTGAYLLAIAMLASPTLILVSGSVTGFLYVTRRNSFDYLRHRLLDRGVFLILIAHPILASSGWFTPEGLATTMKQGYITDVIAIAIMCGPTLVEKLRSRNRLLLAALLFSLDWVAIVAWGPQSHAAALFKHYFIGIIDPLAYGINFSAFPVVPWFALYLVGTVIGERLGSLYRTEGKRRGHAFLTRLSFASAGLGIAAKTLVVLLKHSGTFSLLHPNVMRLLSSYQKFPPGPVYALFYSGIGLVVIAAILEADRRGHFKFLIGQLRQIGEASLVVYATQFYVYSVIVRGLHLPYSPLWPIAFLLTIEFLALCATYWNTRLGNHLLTVGLTSALNRRAARKQLMLSNTPSTTPVAPPSSAPVAMAASGLQSRPTKIA